MASPYDKMTLADLRTQLDKRVQSLLDIIGGDVPADETEPAEASVTELPLSAARAQAARNAANSQGM